MKVGNKAGQDQTFEAKPKPAGRRKYRREPNEYDTITRQESELKEEAEKLRISYEIIDAPTNTSSEEHTYYYVDRPVGFL
jgi:hypothetical protein